MHTRHVALPIPDDAGVYTFSDDLRRLFVRTQKTMSTRDGNDPRLRTVTAPLSGERYRVTSTDPAGRPVLALEPHPDDLVLSAGGRFLSQPRPLTVVTVFSRSSTVKSELARDLTTEDAVTALRAAESEQALSAFGARTKALGFKDADRPFTAYTAAAADQVYQALGPILEENPGAELIAPAAVCRHPDHRLVHDVARALGCTWFWDDTGYQPTYAASVNDRRLFETRTRESFSVEAADITSVALDKLALLQVYRSQIDTFGDVSNVLRYNWTVADAHFAEDHVRYAERFFRVPT